MLKAFKRPLKVLLKAINRHFKDLKSYLKGRQRHLKDLSGELL